MLTQKGKILMPPVKPSKKTNTGTPGVKMLITAASLAATVGGWALISAKETKPMPVVQPPAAAQAVAPVLSIKLAPLPTLVPAMAGQTQIVTVSNQRAASAPRPAVAAPRSAVAAPQPALVLRDVSAPAPSSGGAPAPAAHTGSSR
jgi:hypothetical protein